jgi:hypothetical protein
MVQTRKFVLLLVDEKYHAMKKLLYLTTALLLLFPLTSCQEADSSLNAGMETPANFDEEAELADIMKVIENETACFFARDYECWKENWVDADYAFQAWSNADGTYDAKVGWSEIDRRIGKYIKEHPASAESGIQSFKAERLNLRTKFYGDKVAHLIWEQNNSNADGSSYKISQEVRLMEKVDGDWKIVNVSAFWDYIHDVPAGSFVDS